MSNIANNLVEFVSINDCSCNTTYCDELEYAIELYLNKISQSNLYNKIPGEEPVVLNTEYFDMLSAKVTPWIVNDTNYTMGSDSPNLTISVNTSSSLNCSEEWDLHYYAFKDRSQIFNCETKSSGPFTEIMLSIKNSSGIELTPELRIKVDMPGSAPCPSGCTNLQNSNTGCQCELSLFEVKSQIGKIFRASDLDKALN